MSKWTAANMPDQSGRIVIVTGANSGLGLQTSLELARKGARVIMACRNLEKGTAARKEIGQQVRSAALELRRLDLGDLDSVHTFAAEFNKDHPRLDVLYNNAGLMAIPRQETAQGFEMQFGVNHLGHFALTGLLLERLFAVPGSRVVTLSSTAAFYGQINFDDLQSTKEYSRYGAYGQSKLANLLFARQLQRRLEAAGAATLSLAAHPGLVLTELQARASYTSGNSLEAFIYENLAGVLAQSVEMGTLPQLYAGTAPDIQGGGFYGPQTFHVRGYPALIRGPQSGWDEQAARRLWEVSEQLTGVNYTLPEAVAA